MQLTPVSNHDLDCELRVDLPPVADNVSDPGIRKEVSTAPSVGVTSGIDDPVLTGGSLKEDLKSILRDAYSVHLSSVTNARCRARRSRLMTLPQQVQRQHHIEGG